MKLRTFLKCCADAPLLRRICGKMGIKKIDLKLLKQYEIFPDSKKMYSHEQIFELYNKLFAKEKNLKMNIQPKLNIDTDPRVKNTYKLIDGLDFSLSPELKRFMLFIMSEKFDVEIITTRKKLFLPENGLASVKDGEDWSKGINEKFYSKEGLVSSYDKLQPHHPKLSYHFYFETVYPEIEKLHSKYPQIKDKRLLMAYIFYGINHPTETAKLFREYEEHQLKIQAVTPTEVSQLFGEKWMNPFKGEPIFTKEHFTLTFIMYGDSIKPSIFQDFFKKNFKALEKEFNEYTKQRNNTEWEFKIHWLVYFLNRKLGYAPSDVKNWFGKNIKKLDSENFKKIIQRIDKQLSDPEGDK